MGARAGFDRLSDDEWRALAMFLAEYPAAGLALAPTLRLLCGERARDADQPATSDAAG